MNFSEWQRVILSELNQYFWRAVEAMWPVAQERKSPVDKVAHVGVQVPANAKFLLFFLLFFNCLFTI